MVSITLIPNVMVSCNRRSLLDLQEVRFGKPWDHWATVYAAATHAVIAAQTDGQAIDLTRRLGVRRRWSLPIQR